MSGEKALAVGLSLTLHACLAWIIVARLAVAPGLPQGTSAPVSMEVPAPFENAVPSEVAHPSAETVAAATAAVSSVAAPAVPPPVTTSLPDARSVKAADAIEGVRPIASQMSLQASSAPTSARSETVSPDASPAVEPDIAPAAVPAPAPIGSLSQAAEPAPASQPADTVVLAWPDPKAASPASSTTTVEPVQAAVPSPASRVPPGATDPEQAAASAAPSAAVPIGLAPSVRASATTAIWPAMPSETPTSGLPPFADTSRPANTEAIGGRQTMAALGETAPRQTAVTASPDVPEQRAAIDLAGLAAPVPPADAARAHEIRAFVDHYDGGPCFFAALRRVSAASAEIESFATAADTFNQFDHALQAATGVEPKVSGQKIWSAQCPAVDRLRQLPRDTTAALSLDLARRDLRYGEMLSGAVHGVSGGPFTLFVISESGVPTDVSDALSERDGNTIFSFPTQAAAPGGPFPQILVLIAGAMPPHHPRSVDDLFQPLVAANGIGYAVAAKMFLVTR